MPPREASNAPTSPSPADQLKRIDIGQDGKETTEDERLRAFVLGEVEKAKKKLSPQALDRLVKAIAEVLSRRESDRAKIREAVQAKLKELSVDVEEQKTLKNIPLHMADRIRDYIPGDFRLKTKNELEEVDSLTPTELTKLKAELESHPKKLEKFIHGWARDHQWRASVRKDHPASFRILTEMFDGYCKKYDIRNPEGDISKQFKELQKVEDLKEEIDNLTAKFRKDIARAKERALRGVNQNVSDKISYTRLIDMLKSDALKLAEKLKKYKPEIEKTRDPMLLEKFNLTELALSSMNRKNSDGKDYIESDGLSAKDAWEFLQGKNDREALFWNQSTSKLVALESQLFGKNVVANLSIKKEHP